MDQLQLRCAQIELKAAIGFGKAGQAIKFVDFLSGQDRQPGVTGPCAKTFREGKNLGRKTLINRCVYKKAHRRPQTFSARGSLDSETRMADTTQRADPANFTFSRRWAKIARLPTRWPCMSQRTIGFHDWRNDEVERMGL
jgi:hypothetical protein